MNRAAAPRLSLLWGSLLSWLVYLVIGGVLVTIIQHVLPDELDTQGHPVGPHVLTLDLAAQAMAAFAAGSVALRFAHDRWTLATAVMGGSLTLLLLAITVASWASAAPWFNVLSLSITLPFFALGAAWRGAGSRGETA